MKWPNLLSLYPKPEQSMQRELRITTAYRSVFRGNPSKEDQDLVLSDLAYHSGFSMVTPPEASDAVLRTNEGKRTLFSVIRSRLTLTPSDVEALENAARREAAMSYPTGM